MSTRSEAAASSRMLFATAAMGTRFEIIIECDDAIETRAIGEAAIAEIERLHAQLSRFSPDSLVSHINRTAARAPVRVDAATFSLLHDALQVWRGSGGAFDPAYASAAERDPDMPPFVLDAADRSIHFTHTAVALDLGAIAKGHAVDAAAAILREHGVAHAFVHGGTSSIAGLGAPCDEPRGWKVALAPVAAETGHGPGHRDVDAIDPLRCTFLRDSCMAASSCTLRDHIFDPARGGFARSTRIATVAGPTARLADAWSTAAAVLGTRPDNLGGEWSCIVE